MPQVSIIIPTHNRCHFVQHAIQSVLAQSYNSFEVIVVDDGSTDKTARVVSGFDDARVRYLYQANAGRSTARNQGLMAAQGVYVALLDDDDLYLPHKLTCQVACLETNSNIDLVAAGTQLIDEDGIVLGVWRTWQDQPQLTLLNCLYACPLLTCTVLFRRRVLDRLNHWFDPEMGLAEDKDFFIRLLHAGCRMIWLPEIVSAYRVHSASSQWDGAGYGRAHQRILDKLFAGSDVPAEVVAEWTQLYAHHHLTAACHAYACGQVASAQQDLTWAFTLQPALAAGFPSPFVLQVAGFASSFRVADPRAYVAYVFDQLPAPLAYLRQHRNEAFGVLHMGRVFRAHAAGECLSPKDWLLGVCYAPRWLRNRGVWSILAQGILNLPVATR